jgi:hypothetical protein
VSGTSIGAISLRLATAVLGLALAEPWVAHAWSPAVNYALNCQGCHLADGSGTGDLVPPLRGSIGRLVGVPEGRAYVIRLPNVASTALDDRETAALLNWVVRQFGKGDLPEDFAPFTAAEVAARRRAPLVDVAGERSAVLAALAASAGARSGR